MRILGLFFIAFGGFALLQSRLSRHKRNIYPGRAGGWGKKNRVPLGRYSCITSGVSFATAGIFMTLEGFRFIEIEPALYMLGVIPLFLLVIAGAIIDDVKKEPNQPAPPTEPSGDGLS